MSFGFGNTPLGLGQGPAQSNPNQTFTWQQYPSTMNIVGSSLWSTTVTVQKPQITPKKLPEEFVAGPVVAYRLWHATPDGHLRSISMDGYWPIGQPIHASCSGSQINFQLPAAGQSLTLAQTKFVEHNPPVAGCGCGIYAMKSIDKISPTGLTTGVACIGRVAIWGRVIEHTDGYRAEWGYPLELWPAYLETAPIGFRMAPVISETLKKVSYNYGCIVRWTKEQHLHAQDR